MNKFVQSAMIQMVDRPNTTPIGQHNWENFDLQIFALMSTFSKDLPSLYESREGSSDRSLLEEADFLLNAIYSEECY